MSYKNTNYHRLAVQVLIRAIDDYATLALPSVQKNKELRDAFYTSCIFLWIDDFFLENFINDNNQPMHISEFFKLASDRGNVKLEELRVHADNKLFLEWKDKNMKKIPQVVIIDGEPYFISDRILVDDIKSKRQIILSSLESTDKVWRELYAKIADIYVEKENININSIDLHRISKMFYHFQKHNEIIFDENKS